MHDETVEHSPAVSVIWRIHY